MSDTILAALIAAVSSSGVTGIILAGMKRRWARQDAERAEAMADDKTLIAIKNALRVLLVDRIKYLGGCYVARKGITLEEKENLTEMHAACKPLGLDGHLDVTMREVERLPIISEGR